MTGLTDIDELLSSWDPPTPGIAFGLGTPADHDLRFSVTLPTDPDQAWRHLQGQESTARQSQEVLATLETQLRDRIAARGLGRSFGLSAEDAPFARSATVLESQAADEEDSDALGQVQTLLTRVQEFVTHFARIETRSGALPFASTQVGWTGDLRTVWVGSVSDEQRAMHLRAVRGNLATRLSLVRLVALIVAGASALAVQWALPGGSLRALPTAWRLARELIAEAKQLGNPRLAEDNHSDERGNHNA